jgi:hypothetical protein
MRKIISILLLTSILFNITGYYFTFLIIRQGYKRDFINYLKFEKDSKAVMTLRITDEEICSVNSEFKWMEDNEFKYQGKMYDVISSEKQGNMNIFRCLNDKNEEKLIAKYEVIMKNHTQSGLPYKQKSNQLLRQIVKEAALDAVRNDVFLTSFNKITYRYSYSLSTFISPVPKKPPKAFSLS